MKPIVILPLLAALLPASAAQAQQQFRIPLQGIQEVPSVSTAATGEFLARIGAGDSVVHYELSYAGLEGDVTQAHIHLGQHGANGGVAVFLCTNLGNAPGVQACPSPPATISGMIVPADVIGPAGQGLAPGEFEELLRALRDGVTYANVHTTKFPGGEIRGQLRRPPH